MTSFTLTVYNYIKRIIFTWTYQGFIGFPKNLLKSSINVKIIILSTFFIDDRDRNGERMVEGGLTL